MPSMTNRSSKFWESPGFIARPPYPKGSLHKNLRVREAFQLAKEWGCKMWHANDNDVCVSHELLTGDRRTVPVSSSRTDTSQALVSLLRKVIKLTVKYNLENPPMAAVPARAVEYANGHAETKETWVPAPMPMAIEKMEPIPEAPPLRITGDTPIVRLLALAQHAHYTGHCEGGITPFDLCPKCNNLREEAHFILKMQEESIARGQEIAELKADRAAVAGELNMAASARDAYAAELSKVQDQLRALQDAQAKPAQPAPSVLENGEFNLDEVAGRRRYWMNSLLKLERKCTPWPGDAALSTKTRMFQALEMLGEQQKWSMELITSMKQRDFGIWRMHIMAFKKEGGARCMVGLGAWNAFETALAKVRKEESGAGTP